MLAPGAAPSLRSVVREQGALEWEGDMQRIDHSNTSILVLIIFGHSQFRFIFFFVFSFAPLVPCCLGPCSVPITWNGQIVAMNPSGWMPLFRKGMSALMRLLFIGDSPKVT